MPDPIQAQEVEFGKSVWTAWGYTIGVVLVTLLGLVFVAASVMQSAEMIFGLFTLVFLLGCLVVFLWREVKSNKIALLDLRLQAAEEQASEQKGIWPPPPSVPKE